MSIPPRSGPRTLATAVAVVTGAGSGIGRATAHLLAQLGARVVAVDLDTDAAQRVVEEIGGGALAHGADVAHGDEVEALAERVRTELGAPDLLVNNAGVGLTGRFCETSSDDWDWILGVNLRGTIRCCAAFGPAMLARGSGHVVNVSSGLAYAPRATEPAYVTTKAAVLALSRCLRADWGRHGVGVSAVCPGVTATAIAEHTRFRGGRADPAVSARVQRLFARGRRPEAVARAIVEAVEKNRPVVPTGPDARVGWVLQRVVPTRVADRLARATLGGI